MAVLRGLNRGLIRRLTRCDVVCTLAMHRQVERAEGKRAARAAQAVACRSFRRYVTSKNIFCSVVVILVVGHLCEATSRHTARCASSPSDVRLALILRPVPPPTTSPGDQSKHAP